MVETWENKFHTTPQLTENLQINITELTFSGMNFNVQAESKSSLTGTDVVDRVVDKHKIQLTERQQVIIKIIYRFVVDHVVEGVVEDGVEIPTARSIAKQLETSPRTIQRELAYLQSQNIIIRRGNDYGGYWEIIE
jgi:predicted HTH transcriptional regulator